MFRDLLYLSYKDCGEWKPQLVAYNYAQVPVEGDFLLVSREKQTAKRFFDLYGSYARFVDYCGKGIGRVFERAYLWGGKNVTRHMTRISPGLFLHNFIFLLRSANIIEMVLYLRTNSSPPFFVGLPA